MGFDLSINASAISAFGASMGRSVVCSKRLPHTPSVTVCYENRWRVTGLSQVSACKRAAVSLVLFCFILFLCRSFSPRIMFSLSHF